jgi:hypothetical protein
MQPRIVALLVAAVAVLIFCIVWAAESVGSVDNGTYVIKQAAVSGELTAHMKPGMFNKNWGTVSEWPVAETFYFTKDAEGARNAKDTGDDSIEVRFNDGAVCNISGTCRVDMPRSEVEAIALITKHGYRTHEQVEQKLILPIIRRALIMTANLMSSKESYSDRRPDFFKFAWDQIANGVYQTRDESIVEIDPITQEKVTRTRKTILVDKEGHTLREQNPLEGTGITLSIFEIKNFAYEAKVQAQIGTQQDAIMAVQTARANAQKATQDALTAEANGKAAVMKAKYEEEEKKARATVKAEQEQAVAIIAAEQLVKVAEKDKETALIGASKEKEVAAVNLDAAKLTKQQQIELATGQSESRKLILAADGALAQKLEAYTSVQKSWADAYARRAVPQVEMGGNTGGAGGATEAQGLLQLLEIKAAKDLALDLAVPRPSK